MHLFLLLIVLIVFIQNSGGTPVGLSEEKCGYTGCPILKKGVTNVHIIPHSHDDVGWKKTLDQYFWGSKSKIQLAGAQYILDSVVQELTLDPGKRFVYVETAFLWKWWNQRSERMRDNLRKLVRNGQLEIIGGAWSMHDEACTHYQATVDQFTWGFRRLNDTFGRCATPRIGWQIDPFGHSAETASIMARLGFDAFFVGRVDYREKGRRLWNKELQMIWESSRNLGREADIFSEILFSDYSAPSGFCFDITCNDEPIIDDKDSPDYNLDRMVRSFLSELESRNNSYKGNNIILLMGGDFNFMAAQIYFTNLDKLIKAVNDREDSNFHLFYSTPSCYVKAVHEEGLEFPTKQGDFFPYGSDYRSYWTGYYTSRPTLKRFERISNNFLQVCKQLAALSNRGVKDRDRVDVLREAMGVLQHHDAISGTEQQHVAEDYARLLSLGLSACGEVAANALNALVSKSSSSPSLTFETCLLLNISQCAVSESEAKFVVTLYNPLSRPVTRYVRLPLPGDGLLYSVLDHLGKEISTQMVPVAEAVLEVPGRVSQATVELVFRAVDLPGLGFRSYYVTSSKTEVAGTVEAEKVEGAVFSMGEEDYIKLTFDSWGLPTQVFSSGISKPLNLSQNFFYYTSAGGSNYTASGAYAFRPDGNKTVITQKPSIKYFKGSLVEEVHQQFSIWVSQVIRIYKGEKHIEFNWLVGPIPVENDTGKEVVTLYKLDGIGTSDTFYTDSNGRDMLKRVLNDQSVPANYYPVTTRLSLKAASDNTQISVITDRAEGATSLADGEMEIMLHRRPLHDDGFWLFEGLNEMAYGEGLVARGTHCLTAGPGVSQSAEDRRLVQERVLDIWTFLNPTNLSFQEWQSTYNMEYTGLKSTPHKNIQILTLEPWKENSFLLRLENILEKEDDQTANLPISVNIQEIFKPFSITKIRETSLGANQWMEDFSRLVWKGNQTEEPLKKTQFFENNPKVTLGPMEIKTFIIDVLF